VLRHGRNLTDDQGANELPAAAVMVYARGVFVGRVLVDPQHPRTRLHPPLVRHGMDRGAKTGEAPAMPAIGTTNYPALDAVLTKLGAQRTTEEVHALFLGALTSTSLRLGPQHLLGHIFGDLDRLPGASVASLGVVLGYWNYLLDERKAGRVRLAPRVLAVDATTEELQAYASRRRDELTWYVRGIDAGGDEPVEFGPHGERLLQKLAEARGFLGAFIELLGRQEHSAEQLRDARVNLLKIIDTAEHMIADLMETTDAVRREAIMTHQARQGRMTDDGVPTARSSKVPRNSLCPCGSGVKWKKCCGSAVQPH
jgi:hypothetical protein